MADNHTRIAAVPSIGRRPSDSNGRFKFATIDCSNGAIPPLIDPRRARTQTTPEMPRVGFLHGAPAFVLVQSVYLAMCLTRCAGNRILALGRKTGLR